MGKISTYGIDSIPTLNDRIIGTDGDNFDITKNFKLGDILSLLGSTSAVINGNLLDWDIDNNWLAPYAEPFADPLFPYFYTGETLPSFDQRLNLDGYLYATGFYTGIIDGDLTSRIEVVPSGITWIRDDSGGDNVNGEAAVGDTYFKITATNSTGASSYPILIGSEMADGDFNGEHLYIDDYNQLLDIAFTNITFSKGTPSSYLFIDENNNLTYVTEVGYWKRTAGILEPVTAGDSVRIVANTYNYSLWAESTDYNAIYAKSTNGYGVYGYSQNGCGLYGYSVNNYGITAVSLRTAFYAESLSTGYPAALMMLNDPNNFVLRVENSSTSATSLHKVFGVYIKTYGVTAGNGLGSKDVVSIETTDGSNYDASYAITKWVNATTASRMAIYELHVANTTFPSRKFSVSGAGNVTFDNYGSGLFTGTPTYFLAVDVNGNLIEVSNVAATASNGLTAVVGDVQLGGVLTKTTTITGNYAVQISNGVASTYSFAVTNSSGSGSGAVYGSGYVGVYGAGTAYGIQGFSGTGAAGYFSSSGGYGLRASVSTASSYPAIMASRTNTAVSTLEVVRVQRDGVNGADGLGGSVNWYINNSGGVATYAGKMAMTWSDGTASSVNSYFTIYVVEDSVEKLAFKLFDTGKAQLLLYGDGSFLDSPMYMLGVKADGTVVETAMGTTAKTSTSNAGYLGEESYYDGYMYKCVVAGSAGNATWVKWAAIAST